MERTAKSLHKKLANQQLENVKLVLEFLEDKNHGDALHEAVYHAFSKIYLQEKEQ